MASSTNTELITKAQNAIELLRPFLQEDGGDIRFVELTDQNILNVELQGSCGTCPFSKMTLKNGVEEAVRRSIPEIVSVEDINM